MRVVQLGTTRGRGEGLRIGAVRRPPRGVPKSQYATQNWYDAWLPELAPSARTVKLAQAAKTDRQWKAFVKRYRTELAAAEKTRILRLLAAMSRQTNFSLGCYCADESHCHRSILRALLKEHGAQLV
jgi:uncharacterized protein YeaO (DUF488 family)